MFETFVTADSVDALCAEFGGYSFGGGVYRVASAAHRANAQGYLDLVYPELSGLLDPFASDWLGRIFAWHKADNLILLAEPGTAELLTIPQNLRSFHNVELVENADAAVAKSLFENWIELGHAIPAADQCASHRKPLFLGGEDSLDNLEISDLDVHWAVSSQVISQLKQVRRGS